MMRKAKQRHFGKGCYIAYRSMDDFINSRYSRKVGFRSINASKTSDLYAKLFRKESADPSRVDIFRPSKVLPLLDAPRHHYPQHLTRQVNLSTDMKRMGDGGGRILKRDKHNLTRFSVSRGEREDEEAVRWAVCSRQGRRSYNEDRYLCRVGNYGVYQQASLFGRQHYDLFAVFDGHGGANCAEFLKEQFPLLLSRSKLLETQPQDALKETFAKCQQKFLQECDTKEERSGSCAVVCLLIGGRLIVANLGDSRALLLGGRTVLELTRDHKPHDPSERIRIIKHGGKIYREQEGSLNQIKLFRQVRVLPGNLNVTRTIGDPEAKLRRLGGLPGMISAIPDITTHDHRHHDILLLASDGLFEAFDSQQIMRIYEGVDREHEGLGRERKLRLFVDRLCQEAQGKSGDNITAVAVLLK